jgi:hypothetical protein
MCQNVGMFSPKKFSKKWHLKKREFATESSFKKYSLGFTFDCESFVAGT